VIPGQTGEDGYRVTPSLQGLGQLVKEMGGGADLGGGKKGVINRIFIFRRWL